MSEHRSPAVQARRSFTALAPDQFRPSEAVRILGVAELDYRQVQTLARIASGPDPGPDPDDHTWASVTYLELLGMREAVRLCVDVEQLHRTGKARLSASKVADAVVRLRGFGFTYPLLQTLIERDGPQIMVTWNGITFEVRTGQLRLDPSQEPPVRVERLISADPDLQPRVDRVWADLDGHRAP